jgi:hypothetical protein
MWQQQYYSDYPADIARNSDDEFTSLLPPPLVMITLAKSRDYLIIM